MSGTMVTMRDGSGNEVEMPMTADHFDEMMTSIHR